MQVALSSLGNWYCKEMKGIHPIHQLKNEP